jgi:hypothetical protein
MTKLMPMNRRLLIDKKFEGELEDWRLRQKELQNELGMAFALIKDYYCTKTTRDGVKAHPDYEAKFKDDLIELLKAIGVLTHHAVRAQY